ncbi:DUF4269 domain-containing protein [Chryseobacterium nematophagum]|uniref:DUF4269 domain-containing protein n=1 Tax=Chryseobacterium nematophagum TaxID=2305228 RepID=A0A3M7TKC4_9FLAO|nr:DUF4269 domain-containing protein [Chryseobacterium nematophagum]RNA63099.1 DUF4269 domain-containing protein [Chryseobacterium nematophagum]
MIDFTTIDYLKKGNERQKRAYEVLVKFRILEYLAYYSPILVGTIPIGIDVEGSDLDIICEMDPQGEADFLEKITLSKMIPPNAEYSIENTMINEERCVILNFQLEEFPIEIFGQNKPTMEQNAYRHMIAEYKILEEKGDDFKQKIIKLKKEGMKTEPAFGILLNLENPYEDLLKL